VRQVIAERSKRVDAVRLGYSGDRDAAGVDFACTSAAKLPCRERDGERRDTGDREDERSASLDRSIPETDIDVPAGASNGGACNALGGSTDGPD
jgi:hypothetical protein